MVTSFYSSTLDIFRCYIHTWLIGEQINSKSILKELTINEMQYIFISDTMCILTCYNERIVESTVF